MKLYLSGPMTGYKDYNYPAFDAEADRLRKLGYTVLNPADIPKQVDWTGYMREAIKMLMDADKVAVLPKWEESKGARIEVDLARELGIKVANVDQLRKG